MIMLWDNVLIRKLEKKTKLIMPDKQASIPNRGEVIGVGPGDHYGYPRFVPTAVKVGQKVIFSKDRALDIEIKGERLFIVRERDVLGVLNDEELAE